jgi:probable phosphoglycerate mutase
LSAPPARLAIVRHGETAANLEGRWHGHTDTPLSARGERQAECVGEAVANGERPAAIYTSPLIRARHTAEAIGRATGVAVQVDATLREYGIGRFEGMRFRELHERYRFWSQMRLDPHYAPHGGESPRAVTDRLVGALRRIAAAHRGSRVAVVSHGGALSMALGEIVDGVYWKWNRVVDNCSLSELVLEPEPTLLRYNDTAHLEAVGGLKLDLS